MPEMSEEMSLLFKKMTDEMKQQTKIITQTVTENVLISLESTLKPIIEENKVMKAEIDELHKKINQLETSSRRNNFIIHGIAEEEKNQQELREIVIKTLENIDVPIEPSEMDRTYRLGKKREKESVRPILVSTTTFQKKIDVVKNKRKMTKNTYITEDLTKEGIELQNELRKKLKSEREKGNYAYIYRNEVIVKGKYTEKRKRTNTNSPSSEKPNDVESEKDTPAKIQKADAFAYMRARAYSKSEKNTYQI